MHFNAVQQTENSFLLYWVNGSNTAVEVQLMQVHKDKDSEGWVEPGDNSRIGIGGELSQRCW